ncbi:ankyrin repeat domain-containing protein [Acidobacteriota bacterium]
MIKCNKNILILSVSFIFINLMFSMHALSQEIIRAAEIGDIIKIKELLKKDPELANAKNISGLTPLHYAALYGNKNVVELLISNGADIQMKLNDGTMPLHLAVGHGYVDIARLLIANGADIHSLTGTGDTLLHHAAFGGDKESTELLLEKGAEINARNREGRTPLFIAATRGNKEIVDLLLARGVEINMHDIESSSILHGAASYGHGFLVERMITKGADINTKSDEGGTLLHSAAAGGLRKIVRILISKGFAINAINNAGRTPVFYAVREGHKEIVELLIAQGAKLSLRGDDERTLLHIAEDNGHNEIARLLIANGIEKNPRRIYLLKDKQREQKKTIKEQMEIYYIGNEGFLISYGSKKVLIDAIHKHPWYLFTPEDVLKKMMDSQPPFENIDLLLVTHSHGDHFDPHLTARFLSHNPGTILVSDPRVIERLKSVMKEDFRKISKQVKNIDLNFGEAAGLNAHGIQLKALGLSHGYPDYLNLGFIINFNGITLFHPGDMHTEPSKEYLKALNIENEGIDIVFRAPVLDSPLWKDNKPQYYIAMHIRPEQMESSSKEILKENPDAIIFTETMEKKVFK